MSRTKKRQPREIEQKRNRAHRRQQEELLGRYLKRRNYPTREEDGRYH